MKRRLAVDLAGLAPDLVRLVRELVAALHARGPGGARITPEEWAALGEAIGVVAAGAIGELQKNRSV